MCVCVNMYIILNHTQISADVWPKLVIGNRPHFEGDLNGWNPIRAAIMRYLFDWFSSCYGVCTDWKGDDMPDIRTCTQTYSTFGSIEVVETGRRRKEEGSKKTARVLGVQMCFSYVSATLWVRTIVDQLDWNDEKPQTHRRFLQLYNSLPLALGEAEGCRIPRLQGFKELEAWPAWPHATYAGQCNPKNFWWLMGPCAVLGSGSHIQRSQADRGAKAGYFFGEARWSPSLTDFSNDPSVCLEPSWAYFACLAGVSRNFLRPTGFGSLGLVRWE